MPNYVSNLQPGSFQFDGTFYTFGQVPAPIPSGSNTGLAIVVGTATDGPFNIPRPFSNGPSGIGIFGNGGTGLPHSLMRTAQNMMPEVNAFIGIRVGDTTQAAASIQFVDAATPTPGVVATAVMQTMGTNGNGAFGRADLQSGSLTAAPVFKVTLTYPGANAEVYARISGAANGVGAYNATAFLANLQAAVNGVSSHFVIVAGTSTLAPVLATSFGATGGSDGSAGVGSAQLMGIDGNVGRTGIYAASGTKFAGVVVAGLTDPTVVQTGLAFVHRENPGGFFGYSFPMNTDADTVVALKAANGLSDSQLICGTFWNSVYDAAWGGQVWVPPVDKIMAIILSTLPYKSPSNKPTKGAVGVTATEYTATGLPVADGEKGQLQQNGVQWLSNQNDGAGGLWRLSHGKASDGSNISDTRMKLYIASVVPNLLGNLIGEMQGDDAFDDTSPEGVRYRATAQLNAFGSTLVPPPNSGLPKQLQAFRAVVDLTNNSPTTVGQGYLISNIYGKTRTGVEFALAAIFVGNTIQIVSANPTPVAA